MNAFNFENLQSLSRQQMETATSVASVWTRGIQEIASHAAEYSRHSLSASAAAVEKLVGARSMETALQIQSDFARAAMEGFVERSSKINEVVARLASDAMKVERHAVVKP